MPCSASLTVFQEQEVGQGRRPALRRMPPPDRSWASRPGEDGMQSTLTRELLTAEYSRAVRGRVLASCQRPSQELSLEANRRHRALTQLTLEAGANQARTGRLWPSNTRLHDAGQPRDALIRASAMARRARTGEGLETR